MKILRRALLGLLPFLIQLQNVLLSTLPVYDDVFYFAHAHAVAHDFFTNQISVLHNHSTS